MCSQLKQTLFRPFEALKKFGGWLTDAELGQGHYARCHYV